MCVCGCVNHDKTKTPDRSDLKLGTSVVLDTMSKPIDFGFKGSRVGIRVKAGIGGRLQRVHIPPIVNEIVYRCKTTA